MKPPKISRNPSVNRALLVTIVSMTLVFSFMTVLSVNAIQRSNLSTLREQDEFHAQHTALLVQDSFTFVAGMLTLVQKALGPMDLTSEVERATADGLLVSLMELNPNVVDSWFAFKRGVFEPGRYYIREFIRRNGVIENVPRDLDDSGVEDTEIQPWIAVPMIGGEVYFDGVEPYDYGEGIGYLHTATLAFPVRDPEGGLIGVCGIDIQYRGMFLPIDNPETVNAHSAILLSEDMRILHSRYPQIISENLADYLDVDALKDKNASVIVSPFTGERVLASLRAIPVSGTDWAIPLYSYLETPFGETDTAAGHVITLMVAAGSAGLGLLIFIVYISINSFVKPLRMLTADARQVAMGNLDVPFAAVTKGENPKNEVTELRHSLMIMVETLKNHLNVVEQRVDERTYELKLMTKEAEEAKNRAEEADIVKTQFLANVSHEIRTPMNAIIGMSDLMLSEELNTHLRRYAEDIKVSATSLLGIINDILDISKIQARKLSLVPAHFNFLTLLDNIDSIVGFLVSEKEIDFQISRAADLPRCLYGDDIRLRQILLNVLGNAVKFTEKGFVRLVVNYFRGEIEFIVSDSGIGIPNEELPKLFEAFRQADPKRNRYRTGTGLGLSITKSLVDIMGGEITVQSVYGQGSVFRITLPATLGDESLVAPDEKAVDAVYAPSAKVLVVDDNAINLNVACGLLRLCGITADTVLSGADAIRTAKRQVYDLIFMDHMMPEMDGNEATVILRRQGVTAPIIALTANAVAGSKELFLEAGMNDLLIKPIEKPLFNRILKNWLPPEKLETPPLREPSETERHDKFFDKLKEIKGLSPELGLKRISGQQDVYESSLRYMLRQIEKDRDVLTLSLNALDMRSFAITAHGLKGSLANIGASGLSDFALELESAAVKEDAVFCALNLSAFLLELDDLHAALTDAFALMKGEWSAAEIPPELPPIFANLERALDNMDFSGIELNMDTLTGMRLHGALGDAVRRIKDAVLIMEYDEAKDIIRKTLEGGDTQYGQRQG
ncbi:MAG: response regulator [Oscillospiraceae bacterium]|jgi:signal transduction histidine kinase/CheY-like chemotaxis protein/HPt (histidine-containing phosphotransfer) domain-containing protein|nr:response regulator [Oscillospiraceae bacterium]